MTWEAHFMTTPLIGHIGYILLDALMGAVTVSLIPRAPDGWRRATMTLLTVAFVVLLLGRVMALHGMTEWFDVVELGRTLVYFGTLCLVFRLMMVEQEKKCWKKSPSSYKSSAPLPKNSELSRS